MLFKIIHSLKPLISFAINLIIMIFFKVKVIVVYNGIVINTLYYC
jgi:hypothetical protein